MPPYQTPHVASARAAKKPARGPAIMRAVPQYSHYAADACKRAEQVTDVVDVERQQVCEEHGDDVEETAVEVEIAEVEHRAVGKPALVVGDDQFAVLLLQALVIRDCVFPERHADEYHQQCH